MTDLHNKLHAGRYIT